MMTLRKKVLVLVSAVGIMLALVVLPGCAKKEPAPTKPGTTKTPATKTDKAVKDME